MDLRFVFCLAAFCCFFVSANEIDDDALEADDVDTVNAPAETENTVEDRIAQAGAQLAESQRILQEVLEKAERMRNLAEAAAAEEETRLAEEAARKAEEFKKIREEFQALNLSPSDAAYSKTSPGGKPLEVVDASDDWETRDGGGARTLTISEQIDQLIKQQIADHESKKKKSDEEQCAPTHEEPAQT